MGFKIKIKLLPAVFTVGNITWKVAVFYNIFRYTIYSFDGSLNPFSELGAGGRWVDMSNAFLPLPPRNSQHPIPEGKCCCSHILDREHWGLGTLPFPRSVSKLLRPESRLWSVWLWCPCILSLRCAAFISSNSFTWCLPCLLICKIRASPTQALPVWR